jgi:hypothetical protein
VSSSNSLSAVFSVEGKPSHNRYYHFTTPTPTELRLIRRHHPLFGQTLELVRGGRHKLVVRTTTGRTMQIPRSWTDADGASGQSESDQSVFTVEAIRDLTELLSALRKRANENGSSR